MNACARIRPRGLWIVGAVCLLGCGRLLQIEDGEGMSRVDQPRPDVHVTGKALSFNGQTEIPDAMFGVHATPLDEARVRDWGVEAERLIHHRPTGEPSASEAGIVVECLYDRYQPAHILTRTDWREYLADLGRRYGSSLSPGDGTRILEFWNEPYLNWVRRPGVNYDGIFYDIENARAGAPACLKGTTNPVPGLVWDQPHRVALKGANSVTDYLATRFAPDEVKPGETFTWRDKPFTMSERWWTKDTGQPSWWSGPVSREYYHAMLQAFAEALKRTNPNVKLVAGWGFHLNQDNWRAWDVVHRPLIDFAHEWIDGYNEHHYGGDTRMVAGTYEVAYAYARSRYGKHLKFYNTEAGGMLDPERPGVMKPHVEGAPLEKARGAVTYMLRDILHLLNACPDKAVSRISHQSHLNGGDAAAFRLLKPLRGTLLETLDTDGPVAAVASWDGSNVCVVLFNDSYSDTTATVRVDAPGNAAFEEVVATTVVETGDVLALEDRVEQLDSRTWAAPVRLGPKAGMRLLFRLQAPAAEVAMATRLQFVCPDILTSIAPGQEAVFTIDVPSQAVAESRDVHLRLIEDTGLRWRAADMRWEINGVPMDARVSKDYVNDLPVPSSVLSDRNTITVCCATDAEKGFRICAVSLITTQ